MDICVSTSPFSWIPQIYPFCLVLLFAVGLQHAAAIIIKTYSMAHSCVLSCFVLIPVSSCFEFRVLGSFAGVGHSMGNFCRLFCFCAHNDFNKLN